jgi:thermostable 8-oxoguanine DNA glycosylase
VRYLRIVRAGQYARIAAAFRGVLSLNLRTCTVADLEAVHGIGPKTARMFLLHSRPAQRVAVLDTHILAWLRSAAWPTCRARRRRRASTTRLELAFLDLCDKAGADPASLDLTHWADRTLSKIAA